MVSQELRIEYLFYILGRNVSDTQGIYKTSNQMIQIHCHVLISQPPQEFFLPSCPLHSESHSAFGDDRQDQAQAELNLLPTFAGSKHPGTGGS